MFAYFRRLVAKWSADEVCDLAKEVKSLNSRLAGVKKNRDEWRAECQENATRLAVELDLGKFRASEIERLGAALDKATSAAENLAMATANRDATIADLRDEVERLKEELSAEKHDHAMTANELKIAGQENEKLAEIHATDVERRKAEKAVQIRNRVEAETEANSMNLRAAQEQAA